MLTSLGEVDGQSLGVDSTCFVMAGSGYFDCGSVVEFAVVSTLFAL